MVEKVEGFCSTEDFSRAYKEINDMKFYRNLYIGDSINEKWEKVIWKLRHNAGQLSIYVITLAEGNNLMEFYHCSMLQQGYYIENAPFIIGIAKGYDEAAELVRQIVEEVYQSTGGFAVKEFIMDRQEKRSN